MAPRILFEQELELLKTKVAEMSERAENSYYKLLAAVKHNDREIFTQLLDNDRHMVDMQRSIEAKCLTLLTRQQPVARDLRIVSAALKVVTDIERIGDHVTDLAELFLRMEEDFLLKEKAPILAGMMNETGKMLRAAVEAFVNEDTKAAEEVINQDDVIDDYFNQVKNQLIQDIRTQNPDADKVVDFLMMAKYLEKIGDHGVNIAQWAIFQKTGDIEDVRLL
ncbi:MAG: phosphate signaling complex protein PhoU [Lachnospiraceae bacterium]|nr:phosphate signaling complex protein PhoU [Lachnospiraceae bacterium]MBQ8233439.1 phosphate signaling complex protein PhoU [Lachnospiraceae bacterium]